MSDVKPDETPAAVPILTMDDVQVIKPELGGDKIIVKIQLPITDKRQASNAMTVLNSIALKNHIYAKRGELGLGDYGIEKLHGPRPYSIKGEYEHNGSFDGYVQEFRFTRRA